MGNIVESNGKYSGTQQTQAEILLEIARGWEVFKTPGGELYVRLDGQDYLIRSQAVRLRLVYEYEHSQGKTPNSTAIEEVLTWLESRARWDKVEAEVHTRLAWRDETLYLYLGPGTGAVEITAEGWHVNPDPPVHFRWPKGALPLPVPERGGSIDELKPLLNLEDDRDWYLVVGWLLGALQPTDTGAYPVLSLNGPAGSAKSTATRFLRNLIDPSTAPTLTQPRDEMDAAIKAGSNWVLAYDNVSVISPRVSDALCRIATGNGDSKRQLYSDTDEVILQAKRPQIMNGIPQAAKRGDLLQRSLMVTLKPISENRREEARELDQRYQEARPRILGALCDAIASGLANRNSIHLIDKPRMADLAVWVTAAEEALGWERGTFMEAYRDNEDAAAAIEEEDSPLAQAIIVLMKDIKWWDGSATELYDQLNLGDYYRHMDGWPNSPADLGDKLNRLDETLRRAGILVTRQRTGSRGRIIRLDHITEEDQAA